MDWPKQVLDARSQRAGAFIWNLLLDALRAHDQELKKAALVTMGRIGPRSGWWLRHRAATTTSSRDRNELLGIASWVESTGPYSGSIQDAIWDFLMDCAHTRDVSLRDRAATVLRWMGEYP